MKKNLILFTPFLFTITALSQKPEELFERAADYYQDKKYDSALIIYEKIYENGKGNETLIAKSFYNMGDIYMLKEDYKKAKEIFFKILDSDYDEMDGGGRGEGIMAEPYAQYKNNSSKCLAEISLKEKNYQKALEYTDLFHNVYPYHHFCGNEYKANDIYTAYTYARCYEGLQQTDKAIAALLPECMYSGLANNDYAVEMACNLIKKKYSKDEILKELEHAVSNIRLKTKGHGKYKYDYYYTTVYGTEIQITDYADEYRIMKESVKLTGAELYKYNFIKSSFYKTLINN